MNPLDELARLRKEARLLRQEHAAIRHSHDDDAKAIQTRIANQHTNLITALLYEGVPPTNNHAERMIRPMVVTRKISGGSQSDRGAATHAVNMSVMQTIALQGQSFLKEITRILHEGNPRYALRNGWWLRIAYCTNVPKGDPSNKYAMAYLLLIYGNI